MLPQGKTDDDYLWEIASFARTRSMRELPVGFGHTAMANARSELVPAAVAEVLQGLSQCYVQ